MMPKVIAALVVAFLIFFLITAPHQAHNITADLGHLTAKVAKGLRDFVTSFG
jgi:hypothetical protein